MKETINIVKNFFEKYALVILGFGILIIYFWLRFFKSRMSKILPLDLTVLTFFTTLYICLIFLYITLSLLFTHKANNIIIEEMIKFVFMPIMAFDHYLKSNKFAKPIYAKLSKLFWPKLKFLIIQTNIFYIIFWVFPRLVLLLALYIDVFVFHKFHYKYMVILFGLLLFLNRYFKYSLKISKEQLIKNFTPNFYGIETEYAPYVHPSELEPDYDPEDPDNIEWPPTMVLPFEIYINYHVKSKVYDDTLIKAVGFSYSENLFQEYWIKYSGSICPKIYPKIAPNYVNIFGNKVPNNYNFARMIIKQKLKKYAEKTVNDTVNVALISEFYNKASEQNSRIKILIYSNYFICWLYVLIISLPTLDLMELLEVLSSTWLNIAEPISNINPW